MTKPNKLAIILLIFMVFSFVLTEVSAGVWADEHTNFTAEKAGFVSLYPEEIGAVPALENEVTSQHIDWEVALASSVPLCIEDFSAVHAQENEAASLNSDWEFDLPLEAQALRGGAWDFPLEGSYYVITSYDLTSEICKTDDPGILLDCLEAIGDEAFETEFSGLQDIKITLNTDLTLAKDTELLLSNKKKFWLEGGGHFITREIGDESSQGSGQAVLKIASCGKNPDCEVTISNTIIDGSNYYTCVHLGTDTYSPVRTVTLQGMTIQRGYDARQSFNKNSAGIVIDAPFNLTLQNSVLQNNRSDFGSGGAIAIHNLKEVVISNTHFLSNSSGTHGGAMTISTPQEMTIENCTFSKNHAEKQGGAIYIDRPILRLHLRDLTFEANRAQWGGGIANRSQSEWVALEGCTFKNNYAGAHGAGIYHSPQYASNIHYPNGNLQVINSTFHSNQAGTRGGAIYLRSGSLHASQSQFMQNSSMHGGAICSQLNYSPTDDYLINIERSSFDENEAKLGGALFTVFPSTVSSSTFKRNLASSIKGDTGNPYNSGFGGAIYVMYDKTKVSGSNFVENWAQRSGGAICISGYTRDKAGQITGFKDKINVTICDQSKFLNNEVESGQGGAIYVAPYAYEADLPDSGVYQNLTTDTSTLFSGNQTGGSLYAPPNNSDDYSSRLAFAPESDITHGILTRKSLLNNYDVNYMRDGVKLSFDAQEGEFEDGTKLKTFILPVNELINLLGAPQWAGYNFTCWQDDTSSYLPGDTYTVAGDRTFMAQWDQVEPTDPEPEPGPDSDPEPEPGPEPEPEPAPGPEPEPEPELIILTFDPAGGSWTDGSGEVKIIEALIGEEIVIPAGPRKAGAKFLYWEGSQYYPGQKYTVVGDHDFVAKWLPAPEPDDPPVFPDRPIIRPEFLPTRPVVTDPVNSENVSGQIRPSQIPQEQIHQLPATGSVDSLGFAMGFSALLAGLGLAVLAYLKRQS